MRLIDADRLLQKLKKFHNMINPRLIGGKAVRKLTLIIIKYCKDEQFQIDPESLKEHARWEKTSNPWHENEQFYKCSNCDWKCSCNDDLDYNYCPNCGAKMDLGEGEE